MPETMGHTKPVATVVLNIHTYDKLSLFLLKEALVASLWHIKIASITTLVLWNHY
jgi:hypothetical protein